MSRVGRGKPVESVSELDPNQMGHATYNTRWWEAEGPGSLRHLTQAYIRHREGQTIPRAHGRRVLGVNQYPKN